MLKSGFYANDQHEIIVVFGGRICTDGHAVQRPNGEWIRELSLKELPEDHEIGEEISPVTPEMIDEYHPIRFKFYDTASIDALIKQLQNIKELGNDQQ
jgi:hypothetical protein